MKKTLTLMALAALLLGGCAMTVTERDFLPPSDGAWPVAAVDGRFTRHPMAVTHADGHVSHGLSQTTAQARGSVLFFQGSGEVLDREGATRLWQFERLGLNAYVFDRRGLGQTGGDASVDALADDALALYDAVRARTQGPLLVHGFSLGSVLAAHVARHRPVDALLLEGATPNLQAYLDAHLPWYAKAFARVEPAPALLRYDTLAALVDYRGPVLVVTGEADTNTVPALGEALYAGLASPRKRWALVAGAPHRALVTPQGAALYADYAAHVFGAQDAAR
ncbi:MAG: alpha/beta hydrolase [Proteobacteria bacterium]|nr:alpha/beta hydrolase [Pseudomonadota bacterium]